MESRTAATPGLGTPATQGREGGRPVNATRALRNRRRRPAVLAMSVALIAAGGLGGAVLYNSTGQRIAVLALAHDVPYGQALTPDDLVVARIASDPALAPISAGDLNRAVGRRATTDLHRGALLLAADLTGAVVVQPGMQEVGLPVHPSQLPAAGVQVGTQVEIVEVGDPGNGAPQTLTAVVAQVGKPGDNQVIDVAVQPADAARLAQWAAGGKYQIILAPKGGAGAASPAPQASPSPSSSGSV
ncbi:SAF domain-containing protein [Kitasatospora viridis]|uniref:SAF domain-containing protein n=1 Tax=Kitasatospora viridis TaxID=281105 RepID=A0A561UAS7_9ACTN|nr:SAF domain-containing protein [Kitasatospora viridis]TWF96466.1 SAF domain-containing protein [Kitasatospora viridis]